MDRDPAPCSAAATRTEQDFLQHLQNAVAQDPDGQWIFIVDQLNTHMFSILPRRLLKRGSFDNRATSSNAIMCEKRNINRQGGLLYSPQG
jgi:hypothetical protein